MRATSSDFSYARDNGLRPPSPEQQRLAGLWAARRALDLPEAEQRAALAEVLDALGITS